MPSWRRMFQTITGKPFSPVAAIAAPETFRGARLADENPARLAILKGGSGGVSGTPTVGFGWFRWKNQVGASKVPLRSLYTTSNARPAPPPGCPGPPRRPLRGAWGPALAASGARRGWPWPRPLGGRGLPPGWQGRSPALLIHLSPDSRILYNERLGPICSAAKDEKD